MAYPQSVSRPSSSPRVSLSGNGASQDASSYMGWCRASGSPALLPRTHAAPAPALSLSTTYAVAPGTPYNDTFAAPYSPGAGQVSPGSAAARAAALAACSSPRALGDVPLLLCEQARLATPSTTSQPPARANSERRTRNATAGLAALAADAAADVAAIVAAAEHKKGQLPRNYSSYGADSKWGFDHESVFSMEVDSDID